MREIASSYGLPPKGRLILIVGPSGSGKDTLIAAAKTQLEHRYDLAFSRRVITRADQTGEVHDIVTDAEFAEIADEGGFLLHWAAHGLRYGVRIDALSALRLGKTVIANVSRRVIPDARSIWPNCQVINVTTRTDVRRARLLARGRETPERIEERLHRGDALALPPAKWLVEIDNSGPLAESILRFIAAITSANNV